MRQQPDFSSTIGRQSSLVALSPYKYHPGRYSTNSSSSRWTRKSASWPSLRQQPSHVVMNLGSFVLTLPFFCSTFSSDWIFGTWQLQGCHIRLYERVQQVRQLVHATDGAERYVSPLPCHLPHDFVKYRQIKVACLAVSAVCQSACQCSAPGPYGWVHLNSDPYC